MSEEQPTKTNSTQDMSADDFFGGNKTPNQPMSHHTGIPEAQDIGNMIKDQLKQSAVHSGKYMVIDALLNFLPISEYRQREIARRIANGESINPLEIIFGRMSIGRVIGWVISGVILIFVLIQLNNAGVLGMLR